VKNMDVKKEKKKKNIVKVNVLFVFFFMDVISFHDKICKE